MKKMTTAETFVWGMFCGALMCAVVFFWFLEYVLGM